MSTQKPTVIPAESKNGPGALPEDIDETTYEEPKPPPVDRAALDERMVRALELLAERQDQGPIKQVNIAKAKLTTPWNPSGRRIGRPKLTRRVTMNGGWLREIFLSDEDIALLNTIKAGRYAEGKCIVTEVSSDTGQVAVDIRCSNKSTSDKIWQAQFAPDLTTLLKKVIAEHDRVTA